ncbi:MAG TPA: DUF3107 domain-containing protein [Acidimicrobiales bacterium]|nr:DUF3107 domain-containing protein [Acidimicrobiales bacterium]
MEVRIGVTYTPKEIELDLGDDADRDGLMKDVDAALGKETNVLWVTDRRGRKVGVPSTKIAYVEIGSPHDDRRVGFGAH